MNADILDDNAAEVQVGVNIQVPRSVEVVQDIEFGTLLVDSAKMESMEYVVLDIDDISDTSDAPNVEARGGSHAGKVCTSITATEYASELALPYSFEIAEISVTLTSDETDEGPIFYPANVPVEKMELGEGYGYCGSMVGAIGIPAGIAAGRYEGAIHVSVIYGDSSATSEIHDTDMM